MPLRPFLLEEGAYSGSGKGMSGIGVTTGDTGNIDREDWERRIRRHGDQAEWT